jgi:hypothetical protein
MAQDSFTVNKTNLIEINIALVSQNRMKHCALIGKLVEEINLLRETIIDAKDALKHPDDAFANAFDVYDSLTQEIEQWKMSDRVRIDL